MVWLEILTCEFVNIQATESQKVLKARDDVYSMLYFANQGLPELYDMRTTIYGSLEFLDMERASVF